MFSIYIATTFPNLSYESFHLKNFLIYGSIQFNDKLVVIVSYFENTQSHFHKLVALLGPHPVLDTFLGSRHIQIL